MNAAVCQDVLYRFLIPHTWICPPILICSTPWSEIYKKNNSKRRRCLFLIDVELGQIHIQMKIYEKHQEENKKILSIKSWINDAWHYWSEGIGVIGDWWFNRFVPRMNEKIVWLLSFGFMAYQLLVLINAKSIFIHINSFISKNLAQHK